MKLYEGLVLLALQEETGNTTGSYLEYTIAAAILAELLLLERIRVNADNKDKVKVLDSSPTGDTVMDEALQKIADKKRPDTIKNWVSRIAQISKLKHKVAKQLVADRIVKSEDKKVLWIFSYKVYPELNPEPEQQLRTDMRRLVIDNPIEVDPRISLLVALAKSANLLKTMFSKDELKNHRERIDKIAKGEELGALTQEVISAVQAAMMVAVMMPAIMAATTASTSNSC